MGILAFSVHFSIVIGSAGSEFAFEVIQSDSCTKCPAIAKQRSPAFSPPLSVSSFEVFIYLTTLGLICITLNPSLLHTNSLVVALGFSWSTTCGILVP